MPWTTPPGAGATVYLWNGYSLGERDRRWQAVRENAAKAGFDCVLVPLGNGIDGRYMTQLRCSAMVLPTNGRAPIVIADRRSSNEWVPVPWQTGREWAEPMGEALLDLGMHRARVGVVGLTGGGVTHCNSIDGVVNHTAFEHVMGMVPSASFADATDVVGLVRYVKGEEEIAFVRRSAEVAVAGLDELLKRARPSVDLGLVYADTLARMLELGSEYFPMTLEIGPIGPGKPKRYTNPPIGRRLEKNALVTTEVNAIIGAQLTQVCQPIVIGAIPDAWKPVVALQKEVYEAGLSIIKPGTSFGELVDFVNGFGATRGMKTMIQMHGCGYGDDGPLLNARFPGDRVRGLRIEKGNVFVWKPVAMTNDERLQFSWGGPVLVAEKGAEALFKREHGMVSIV
jgi:Xaa-Pro aminopeptidase